MFRKARFLTIHVLRMAWTNIREGRCDEKLRHQLSNREKPEEAQCRRFQEAVTRASSRFHWCWCSGCISRDYIHNFQLLLQHHVWGINEDWRRILSFALKVFVSDFVSGWGERIATAKQKLHSILLHFDGNERIKEGALFSKHSNYRSVME